MSKKYFLFAGLTIMLLVGIVDIIYAIYYFTRLSSYTSNDMIASFIFAVINVGLCVPSLIMTIKAFKNKENNLTASVLLLIASTLYFGFRVYNVSKLISYPDQDPRMVMYYAVYGLGQALVGLVPVTLAILSLMTFKKSENDYVPSTKINRIFFYIVAAFVFQAFITFSTTGIRGSIIVTYSSSSSLSSIVQSLVYLIGSLGIIGCAIPSFIMSFFDRKRDISRILLLIAAILVTGIDTWSMIISIQSAREYSMAGVSELVIVESVGIILECAVLIASVILMFIKFKTKEPEQIKTELE